MSDILGRVGNILRANLNDAIDHAEDPQKMIDQYIRDFTNDIAEAEQATAQAGGNLRLAEDDLKRAQADVDDWGSKAAAAATRATQVPADSARFDELAKAALRQVLVHETRAETLHEHAAQQTADVHQLRTALEGMSAKLDELRAKGDELAARATMADARRRVRASLSSIDSADLGGDPSSYGNRVRSDDLPVADGDEIERRLAALKGGSAATAGSR